MTRREALHALHHASTARRLYARAQHVLEEVTKLGEASSDEAEVLETARQVLQAREDAARAVRVECERVLVGGE